MTSISKISQGVLPEIPKNQIKFDPAKLNKFLKGMEPQVDKFTKTATGEVKGTKGVSPEYLDRLSGMLGSNKPVVPPVENTISNPPQELPKDFLRFLRGKQ